MHGYPIRRLPVPVPETADHGAGTGREMRARRGRLCPHFERIKPAIYIDPLQLNTNKLLYGLCQTIDVFLPFHFCDYLTYGCETLFNTCVTTASMESSMM